jgi:hypothetical protein
MVELRTIRRGIRDTLRAPPPRWSPKRTVAHTSFLCDTTPATDRAEIADTMGQKTDLVGERRQAVGIRQPDAKRSSTRVVRDRVDFAERSFAYQVQVSGEFESRS